VFVLKRRPQVNSLDSGGLQWYFVYKNEISGVEVAQQQNQIKLAEDNFGKSDEDQGCRSSACQPRDITVYIQYRQYNMYSLLCSEKLFEKSFRTVRS